jgi:hypothetical protein
LEVFDGGENLDQAVGKAVEGAPSGGLGQVSAVHLQDMLDSLKGVDQIGQIRMRRVEGVRHTRRWHEVAGMRAGQLELALEILLSNLEVLQSHVWALVTEEFDHGSEADAGAQHLRSVGVA